MFSNCPSLQWGRPALPPGPPYVASPRTDGRTGEAGGLAWRALCSCRLCWWACRKGSLSESVRCCGPGLGDQQLCPSGRMPRGHQGTRGEADGDLKGPPWGGGHPSGNTCEQAGCEFGGLSAAAADPAGQEGTGKGWPVPGGSGGPIKAGPCPQREGQAVEITMCPGPSPWAVPLVFISFPHMGSLPLSAKHGLPTGHL